MCLEIPQKKGMCFQLTKGLSEKKMVANCLKLQTKARVKEKKEENINKEKNCPPQTSRSMGPSNQKQDLKVRITEFINYVVPTHLTRTFVDC